MRKVLKIDLAISLGFLVCRLIYMYFTEQDSFICGWTNPYACSFVQYLKDGGGTYLAYGQTIMLFLGILLIFGVIKIIGVLINKVK